VLEFLDPPKVHRVTNDQPYRIASAASQANTAD
jgi:hypothetical protein